MAVLAAVVLAASHPLVPKFGHVIVVVFENHERSQIVGSPDAPTFNALAKRYASVTNYNAVAHPSLPNYLALVSGSTQGITSDCTDCTAPGKSLADSLGAAGRTWKTYAEGYPSSPRYAKKHNPFLYFPSTDVKNVVGLPQLAQDVRRSRLPDFSLVVPDLCDDMHDCSVATGDAWLKSHVAPLAALRNTVVFVVFDEGTSDAGGGGNVDALVLGPYVRPGSTSTRPTSHYGLLRTIEQAWHLPYLGASAQAKPITGIWR
jgi:phosphatidylinositol-3-phosphatase